MNKSHLSFLMLAGIASITGCAPPTTGPEIDRIMAEARRNAANDLARTREGMGATRVATRIDTDPSERPATAASTP
jgi:hypothetical protein